LQLTILDPVVSSKLSHKCTSGHKLVSAVKSVVLFSLVSAQLITINIFNCLINADL